MSTATPTLNEAGHFFNGVLSSCLMVGALQPDFTRKTLAMMNKGEKQKLRSFSLLYRGLGANCAGIVPSQTVAFFTNGVIRKYVFNDEALSFWQKLGTAVASGIAGAPVITAGDRVMTVSQLSGNSMMGALVRVLKEDGLKGLFSRALPPTCFREAIFITGVFSISDEVDGFLKPMIPYELFRKALAAASTGTLVGWATTPFDLIKTRMQGDPQNYPSMRKTASTIMRTEGIMGFTIGGNARAKLVAKAMGFLVVAKDTLPSYFPSWMWK